MDTTPVDRIDLRRLADMEGPERAFVSLYFSDDPVRALDEREARVSEVLPDEGPEREHFEETVKMMRGWLEAHRMTGPGCLFAAWALDFCEGYTVTADLPNRLQLGDAPYIRPLANLQDELETFALVIADNDATQIYLSVSGEMEPADRVKGGVKNHVKKGGWSQKRYQKRRANQLMHYAKEVGEALRDLAQEEPFGRVVFLGSSEAMDEIVRELPTEIADKAILQKAADLHDPDEALFAEAFELYFEEERRSERRLWDRIQEEYLSGGLAVVGPTDVLQAVLTGRVEEIAVTRDVRIRGVKCRDCENVVHGTPDTCQICGSSSVFTLDLVDELARAAERTSADVDFVDPIPELSKVKDVAAILRY